MSTAAAANLWPRVSADGSLDDRPPEREIRSDAASAGEPSHDSRTIAVVVGDVPDDGVLDHDRGRGDVDPRALGALDDRVAHRAARLVEKPDAKVHGVVGPDTLEHDCRGVDHGDSPRWTGDRQTDELGPVSRHTDTIGGDARRLHGDQLGAPPPQPDRHPC